MRTDKYVVFRDPETGDVRTVLREEWERDISLPRELLTVGVLSFDEKEDERQDA